MTDSQFAIFCQPDVCFNTSTSRREGSIERNRAPVIIVGVAALGYDVTAEVISPVEMECLSSLRLLPGIDDVLKATVLGGRGESLQQYGNKGYVNTAVC